LKDLKLSRWRPRLPQALAEVASLAFLAFSAYLPFFTILAKNMIKKAKKINDTTTKMIVKAGKPLIIFIYLKWNLAGASNKLEELCPVRLVKRAQGSPEPENKCG
jgi:hypothetical protein